jgi:signal transduction histidine kinase
LTNEVIELLDNLAKNKNIRLNNDINPEFDISCDKEMTKTILRNLISNAIKFTTEFGTIALNARQINQMIEISIKDSGVGISEERLNKLFRIEKNTSTLGTSDEKGTGLGLILCKELIEKQGGNIWVLSVVGQGTEFKFTLPYTA